jgi:nucleotide-binding universal stress UspA family protein
MHLGIPLVKKQGGTEMKEKILFVTKGGENTDEGFSYALELAKALNSGIAALVIYPRQMMAAFEDVMSAAAFAEAGDFSTVRALMDKQEIELRETEGKKILEMKVKAGEISVGLTYKTAAGDVAAAITDYLKERTAIEMVLLSPNLSQERKFLDIRKLLRKISKPIVNITLPEKAEA